MPEQFEVLSDGSNLPYCKLKPLDSGKIHPVFTMDLHEQYKVTDPKKQIIEIGADGEDWVMV